ncbi:MAG: AraC family transcriptional regulator [Oscillospiraceae bacterium]|jgi:AraC-like DNA-binding protein|nr:AraC family transcriptional regulator [Oscillospiraceae bacterium]
MELPDKVAAVSRMQGYIGGHIGGEITLDALSRAAGYSKYYAARIFKELTGRTPFEAVRALRLTRAAQTLRDAGGKVVDTALDNGFDSHDGFTRAFARQFGITPRRYGRETPPVSYFIQYPVEAYYTLKEGGEPMPKELISRTMTVTAAERPARKLILKRARKAKAADGYLVIAEELGCEWEGQMNSIPESYHGAAGLTLPPGLIIPGTTDAAVGTEVPLDYGKPVPEGFEVVELPPCTMLYFQGAPFEDENDFSEAIGILWELMNAYDPALYGWEYAPELAPYCNFGAAARTGARMARPVKRREK